MSDELVSVPQDLKLLSDDELGELESRATQEFDRLTEADDVTPESIESLQSITQGIERLRAEKQVREDRARREAEHQRTWAAEQKTALATRVHGAPEASATEGGGEVASSNAEEIAAAAARGVTAALISVLGDRSGGRDLTEAAQRATASLSDARRYAPAPPAPKPSLAITAGVDIPGLARGAELNNIGSLTDAFHRRARSMTTTRGNPSHQLVASIRNEFEHTIDDRTTPGQVNELFAHLTRRDAQEALLAAGGWCAPSEIRYEFFNIACEDGTIDLPTFGVTRGGIRYPTSPSLADVFDGVAFGGFGVPFSGTSVPWLWTEADDEAAVTGSPTKPCIRVPCPDFEERRLECYGVCLTAGNLTDDAYPEATQNFLRLLMSAHAHAMNARFISTMVGLSEDPVSTGAFAAGGPVYNAVLSGTALAATDYRARYGMCEDDILEVVIPQWIVGAIQADLSRRAGTDQLLSVTRAQISSYFADRNVRVQFVNDWQVRGADQFGNPTTAMTSWPGTVDIMVYAAGTFLLGNGLSLDLGVVRDSTLNETNDHTAAWSEECHLIARVGHESRLYTITMDVRGDTCCTDLSAAADIL